MRPLALIDTQMVQFHLFGGPQDGKVREITLQAVQDQKTVEIVTSLYSIEWNSDEMRWEGHFLGKLHNSGRG